MLTPARSATTFVLRPWTPRSTMMSVDACKIPANVAMDRAWEGLFNWERYSEETFAISLVFTVN
jgi:hypothetical protein